jgi:Tol biopolymer transport system component
MRKSYLALCCALTAALLLVAIDRPAFADRQPVLNQVQVPHSYYYREMFLPQLTTGPSSLAWSPDGKSLVFSMGGSLWRQDVDSGVAFQLTAGPGYDYQPDWSPDGATIAFVRYDGNAMELQSLHLDSGEVTALTSAGAVNVEPRWSPDGSKIAFVSTSENGRFHLYVGDYAEDTLTAAPLLKERQSEIYRYYYSAFDHELSPSWSPDGSEILYVGNPEIPYGSGAIWRRPADGSGKPTLVRKEETSWKARPDWAPDGNRIAYASYLGRQWHQLWVATPENRAEPFPLTYGDFDITSPRWSPDGHQIAFVTNESGNTAIQVQDMVGGKRTPLSITEKRYLAPMATLSISVLDERGREIPGRVAVTAADGRNYAPEGAWMHADDGFDRAHNLYETQYFHIDGNATLTVPTGATSIVVWRGMEHHIETLSVDVASDEDNSVALQLRPLDLPEDFSDWTSSDVHVHMNYGGTYRNTPERLAMQARAEDVDVIFNLIVNKEQRVPDVEYFSPDPDAASAADVLIMHAQEYHTSFWGHMGLIGLDSHLLVPDYSAYPDTAAASIYPDNATIARLAHEQQAAVGYVHPFEPPAPDPGGEGSLTNAFPVDAALGLVDYYEVVGFADPHTSADVWYGLLNCGIQVAAAGGTDAMANYTSLRGPVGINRTYVHVPGLSGDPATRQRQWLDGLKAGTSMATNGPLVDLTVDEKRPGSTVTVNSRDGVVRVKGFMQSVVPVDHVELLVNGEVVRTYETDASSMSVTIDDEVQIDRSGWMLLRAWNDTSHPMSFALYPYATTSPVYLAVAGEPARSPTDAEYFLSWVSKIREAVEARTDFNSPDERAGILANLADADARFAACR